MVLGADILVKFGADMSELHKGFQQATSETSSFESKIKSLGGGMTAVGGALTAGLTVPIVALGAFAMKSASDVGGAFKTIQRETGATGPALEALKNNFRNVFSTVPADAQTVVKAMDLIVQRLHLAGPALENLTRQMINYANITGTDATQNTESFTSAMVAWQIPASQMSIKADELYKIFQMTAVPMETLNSIMAKAAGPAQAMGLSYEETALDLARLTEAGMPARQAISMLNTIAVKSGEAGKTGAAGWHELIQRFKEGKETSADIELLGNNIVKFRAQVKAGFYDPATIDQLKNVQDLINNTAFNTMTFGQKLDVLRNKLEVAFQPLGTAIFSVLTTFVNMLTPLINIITSLAIGFGNLPAPIQMVIVVFGGILAAIGPVAIIIGQLLPVLGLLATAFTFISSTLGVAFLPILIAVGVAIGIVVVAVGALAAGFAIAWNTSYTLRDIVTKLGAAFSVLSGHLSTALGYFMSGNWKAGIDEIKKAFSDLPKWLEIIDWQATGEQIVNEIRDGIKTHKSEILNAINKVADDFTSFLDKVKWEEVGTLLGKTIGGAIAVAIKATIAALTGKDLFGGIGEGTIGGVAPVDAQGRPISAGAIQPGGTALQPSGAGWAGLEDAAKKAGADFAKGFGDGLREGLKGVDWGGIAMDILGYIDRALLGGTRKKIGLPEGGLGLEDIKKAILDFLTWNPLADFMNWWASWISGLKDLKITLPSWEEATKGGILDTSTWPNLGKIFSDWWNSIFGTGGTGTKKSGTGTSATITLSAKLTSIDWGKYGDMITKGIKVSLSIVGLVFTAAMNTVYKALQWLYGLAQKVISFVLSGIKWAVTTFAQDVYNAIVWLYKFVQKAIPFVLSGIKWAVSTFAQDVYNAIVWLYKFVTKAIPFVLSGIKWATSTFAQDVYNAIVWLYKFVQKAIGFVLSGIAWGIGFAKDVYDAIKDLWTLISHTLTFNIDIWNVPVLREVKGIIDFLKGIFSIYTLTFNLEFWGLAEMRNFYNQIIGVVNTIKELIASIPAPIAGAVQAAVSAVSGLGGLLGGGGSTAAQPMPTSPPVDYSAAMPGMGGARTGYWARCAACPTGWTYIYTSAEGGVFGAQLGGQLVRVAEAGEAEVIIPWHRVGEDWNTLIPSLQRFGTGGIVGGASTQGVVGSVTSLPHRIERGENTRRETVNYHAYVSVDSENITQKVFKSFRELEDYHSLGRG